MSREETKRNECPVVRALGAIGDGWSLLIIRDAMLGKRRFGEFQKSLGVAKNILTSRLKKLVAHGVMEVVPGEGAYHEYVLTEKGRSLQPVVVAIQQWGEGCSSEEKIPDSAPPAAKPKPDAKGKSGGRGKP